MYIYMYIWYFASEDEHNFMRGESLGNSIVQLGLWIVDQIVDKGVAVVWASWALGLYYYYPNSS